MFQWALGRCLVHDRGVALKLDLSWFQGAEAIRVDTVREYALAEWHIQALATTEEDLAPVIGQRGILTSLGPAPRGRGGPDTSSGGS